MKFIAGIQEDISRLKKAVVTSSQVRAGEEDITEELYAIIDSLNSIVLILQTMIMEVTSPGRLTTETEDNNPQVVEQMILFGKQENDIKSVNCNQSELLGQDESFKDKS